jgi:hypothetical protein
MCCLNIIWMVQVQSGTYQDQESDGEILNYLIKGIGTMLLQGFQIRSLKRAKYHQNFSATFTSSSKCRLFLKSHQVNRSMTVKLNEPPAAFG